MKYGNPTCVCVFCQSADGKGGHSLLLTPLIREITLTGSLGPTLTGKLIFC